MVIKMGGYGRGSHIIGRSLNRGKRIDFLTNGKHNNTARVLSRRSPDTDAALNNPVYFAVSLVNSPFLVITFDKSESCFICQSTDRSGTEGLALSKDDLCIIVGLTLIFSGKVQVNIRFLISLKAQEGLKGNIKALLCHGSAAFGTVPIWHIASCHSGEFLYLLRIKIIVMAMGAQIMGTQGIYFCDSGHVGNKGGTYRASGAYQVAILIGFPYQLLSNNIHHGKAIGNNRMKLLFQSGSYNFRQVFPVHFMGLVIADFSKGFIRVFNNRRTFIRTYWCNALTHISNHPGIGNDHLFCLIRPQVFKFLQHLFCRSQI